MEQRRGRRGPRGRLAEQRGAEKVRRQLRELVGEHRRVVRQGEAQVEVVEISALREILDREG